ncbi:glycosyltransferase family 2 protein [Clostridium butyricum]|uniref:glycosyltransferase family 2 protein n=1 Tax=Clostridium butyricum TaxID=1492 RepID=UPI0005C1482B|nr:glycosyltransferase family 2 protein [Clostridium butyricum]KIU06547.1 bactoprenol glucosyl transferase [Clostridium butyricum]MBA8966387.1 glycosyltransferase involved in cell wall biosynthesis [Clostridium butyricum]MBA8972549.1 glycosyltransferase involved in cell wall biosynthesis [Clostridium butyricum]MBC2428440.1 glycosyltransferase family 2 protein [Clostridium butyricum]NOW35588.1 glycosyltransferase involved in cell wall biosynthesis [Clostridium butyricum]
MGKCMYLVIPCYNEEEVLYETSNRLLAKLNEMIEDGLVNTTSRIMFVNDGSKDNTWNIIEQLNKKSKYFIGVKLTRNKGHQNALLAGLMEAKNRCDFAISLDADLQDDIEVLSDFVKEYEKGNDVVYGVRSSRDKDSFFKKNTAVLFYRLMTKLGVEIVYNHADYRLMSKRALEDLSTFKEVNLFLRGIVPLIGYNNSIVMYERNERFAGESKYPLKRMLSFAINGITSFSVKPIRIITFLGMIMFAISSILTIYFALGKIIYGNTNSGWASLICSIWLLGGIQLLSIGIVGEYVGKIYLESKHRPLYFIEKFLE